MSKRKPITRSRIIATSSSPTGMVGVSALMLRPCAASPVADPDPTVIAELAVLLSQPRVS
jgi:hypothetical protein